MTPTQEQARRDQVRAEIDRLMARWNAINYEIAKTGSQRAQLQRELQVLHDEYECLTQGQLMLECG